MEASCSFILQSLAASSLSLDIKTASKMTQDFKFHIIFSCIIYFYYKIRQAKLKHLCQIPRLTFCNNKTKNPSCLTCFPYYIVKLKVKMSPCLLAKHDTDLMFQLRLPNSTENVKRHPSFTDLSYAVCHHQTSVLQCTPRTDLD